MRNISKKLYLAIVQENLSLESHFVLGESKQIANKKLLFQESKLKNNEGPREKYVSFMKTSGCPTFLK